MRPTTALIAAWRERRVRPMGDRESVTVGLLGAGYLAAAIALSQLLPWTHAEAGVVAAVVVVCAVLARIRLDVGAGSVSPTQLAFIPLLFIAPLPAVALLVPVVFALEELPDLATGRSHPHRWLNWLADSWFAIGPVLILALAAPGAPDLGHWPAYLAALSSQVVLGIGIALLRERLAGAINWRDELRSALTAYQLEVLLAPLGAAATAAFFVVDPLAGLALVAVLAAAIWALARWHQDRCTRAIEAHRSRWARILEDADWCEQARCGHVGPEWRSTVDVALALARQLALPLDLRGQLAHVAHQAANGPDAPAQLRRAQAKLCSASVRADLDVTVTPLGDDADLVAAARSPWSGCKLALPELSRIVAVASAYSALTAQGESRAAYSREAALEQLSRAAGHDLDPSIVAALEPALADPQNDDAVEVAGPRWVGHLPALTAIR